MGSPACKGPKGPCHRLKRESSSFVFLRLPFFRQGHWASLFVNSPLGVPRLLACACLVSLFCFSPLFVQSFQAHSVWFAWFPSRFYSKETKCLLSFPGCQLTCPPTRSDQFGNGSTPCRGRLRNLFVFLLEGVPCKINYSLPDTSVYRKDHVES